MTDHYVSLDGVYIGGFADGATPEDEQLLNLGDNAPEFADQVWQFPGWGPSLEKMKTTELDWQSSEMSVISNQLLALEEEAEDALPGTRKQWLAYRTGIRLWHESPEFPDITRRPVRPT